MHQPQLAAQQFNKAVDINDRIVEAYLGLAIAQKLYGQVPDALTTLSLAAAIQPNSSLLFAETATLRFRSGLLATSEAAAATEPNALMLAVIRAHQEQITRRPQNADLHYRLGVLLMSTGRLPEATAAFQAAVQLNTTYTRAESKYALCLFEAGHHEQALEQLAAPTRLSTDTLQLHYKTALLYTDKVRFASSLLNLERHLAENFTCPDASINISIVLQNLGLLDRATATWDNLSATTDHALRSYHGFSAEQW
jgi:tetratricopeptide (TPR) repeat protein